MVIYSTMVVQSIVLKGYLVVLHVRDETHAYQRAYSKTMNTGGFFDLRTGEGSGSW